MLLHFYVDFIHKQYLVVSEPDFVFIPKTLDHARVGIFDSGYFNCLLLLLF